MNKILSFILGLALSTCFASCGRSEVDKVVSAFNNATEEIQAADNDRSKKNDIENKLETEIYKYSNSTQELTAADKQALAEAWANFEVAFDNEDPDHAQRTQQRTLNDFEEYQTLGQLLSDY